MVSNGKNRLSRLIRTTAALRCIEAILSIHSPFYIIKDTFLCSVDMLQVCCRQSSRLRAGKLHQPFCQRPFNTESRVGPACSWIRVRQAAPPPPTPPPSPSSCLRVSLHRRVGKLWSREGFFFFFFLPATLSHLFKTGTASRPVSFEEWESALCLQIRAISFFFSFFFYGQQKVLRYIISSRYFNGR